MSNDDIPAIPQPMANFPGLVNATAALKQGIEVLAGIRGGALRQAVVFADLIRLGLVDKPTAMSATGKVTYTSPTAVVRKVVTTVGDGSATSFQVQHNLNTIDTIVAAYATAKPYGLLSLSGTEHANVNTTTVVFSSAPPAGGARIVVMG